MIEIKSTKMADSRTCDYSSVSKDMLLDNSLLHITDVQNGLEFFCEKLARAGFSHDRDKISDINGFHRDFITNFKQRSWWDNHRKVNRHHLLSLDGVPADVTLIDVLEMIADCVMAGKARSGTVYPLTIKPEVLLEAFNNTVELLKSQVVVTEGDVKGEAK